MNKNTIIDTHTFWKGGESWGNYQGDEHFENPRFENTKFIVIPAKINQNEIISEIVRNHPRFIGTILQFNPNPEIEELGYVKVSDLEKQIKLDFVTGLKSLPAISRTPIYHELYFPFYELASEVGIPVLLHCSASGSTYSGKEIIENTVKRFPDLKLILAHFGGLNPEYMENAVSLAKEYKNIYLNTACMGFHGRKQQINNQTGEITFVTIPDRTKEYREIFLKAYELIPNQLLLGTDLGFDCLDQYSLFPVDQLKVEDQRKVYQDNPLKLFKNLKII